MDLDGVSPLTFSVMEDNYYVSVHHRNHLDIKSVSTVDCTSGIGTIDFTTQSTGQKLVDGIYVMYKGDVNQDNRVSYNGAGNDKNAILSVVGILTPNNNVNIYSPADVNMNGKVSYNGANNDKNGVLDAVGLLTPNNIINGQFYP